VIYTAENGGIKQEVFLYWPPTKGRLQDTFTDDAREFFFKLDGKNIYPNRRDRTGSVRPLPCGSSIATRSIARARDQGCRRRMGAVSRLA